MPCEWPGSRTVVVGMGLGWLWIGRDGGDGRVGRPGMVVVVEQVARVVGRADRQWPGWRRSPPYPLQAARIARGLEDHVFPTLGINGLCVRPLNGPRAQHINSFFLKKIWAAQISSFFF